MLKLKLMIAKILVFIIGPNHFNSFYLWVQNKRAKVDQKINPSPVNEQQSGNLPTAVKSRLNFGKREDLIPFLRSKSSLPDLKTCPMVSIIIVNRNGKGFLEKLFPSIQAGTVYPRYEIILVDNDSSDASCRYAKQYGFQRIHIEKLPYNHSFSAANNIGAKLAKGEFLVFLNNDIEVCYGWLSEMVNVFENCSDAVCVGSTLVYSDIQAADKGGDLVLPGLSIQHAGIAFKDEGDFFRPYNTGMYRHPLYSGYKLRPVPAVSAACQAWKKEVFVDVGGFDENYFYGYEDVDICLKAVEKGFGVYHCPSSIVLHHEFGTQVDLEPIEKRQNRLNNMAYFTDRWYDYLKASYWSEKLYSTPFYSERPLTIAITVTEYHPATTCGDFFSATGLGRALERLGYQVVYLPRRPVDEWRHIPDNIDILLVMMDDFQLDRINVRKGVLTIAWIRNWVDRWIERPWLQTYDLVLTSSNTSLEFIRSKLRSDQFSGVLRLAADTDIFHDTPPDKLYESDVCFVGNIFNVPREVATNLPEPTTWQFRYWGRLENKKHPFSEYHEGTVEYHNVPAIYNSSKIVLEDCTPMCKPWGCINSRTFEAMACGSCVVSNDVPELTELFSDSILVYKDKKDLEKIIEACLEDEEKRQKIGEKAIQAIKNGHTYDHRALELQAHLAEFRDIKEEIKETSVSKRAAG